MPDRFSGCATEGQALLIGIRPSDVTLTKSDAPNALRATVEVTEYLGDDALLDLRVGPHELIAQVPAVNRPAYNASVYVTFNAAALHLFDAATGNALLP
ncbi:TOBE domain-containing protein [Sinorhizobium medicae]|nr:TOBE domain-containing protein [Sinorhizobium medicae]